MSIDRYWYMVCRGGDGMEQSHMWWPSDLYVITWWLVWANNIGNVQCRADFAKINIDHAQAVHVGLAKINIDYAIEVVHLGKINIDYDERHTIAYAIAG